MLYLFSYIFEITILAIIEKKNWGTYFSPLNCLSIPCGIVTLLAIIYPLLAPEFPKFYLPSLIVWMVGLAIFALPSFCLSKAAKKPPLFTYLNTNSIRQTKTYKYLILVSVCCLLITFIKMRSAIGSTDWGSDEFSESYSSSSIIGHLSVLITVLFSYMIYMSDKNHKLAFLIACLSLISMYAVGVKSWIIAPLLIGIFTRVIIGKTRLTFKFLLSIIVTCICIFTLSYIILMVNTGRTQLNASFFEFIANHFMFYLIGSPLSFSIDYKMGIIEPDMLTALFAPPINIYRLFEGSDFITPINPTAISIIHGQSNVRTFLGTIFAYSHSWWGFISIVLLFSCFTNFIQLVAGYTKNPFLILANCSNLAFLTLGFFEFYWLNLGPYEIFMIFIIFSFLYKYIPCKSCKCIKNV